MNSGILSSVIFVVSGNIVEDELQLKVFQVLGDIVIILGGCLFVMYIIYMVVGLGMKKYF